MNQYIVTYRGDNGTYDETFGAIMNVEEIARLYGFCDCVGDHSIRVFRIAEDGTPIEVDLDPVIGVNAIQLLDRETGNVIDEWGWPEH